MEGMPLNDSQNDDPRKLRSLLDRVVNLAGDHHLKSVLVGMTGLEDDLLFPELVAFVGSSLRIDDSIFRMTRTRAVFSIADSDINCARQIMDRVISDFSQQFAVPEEPTIRISYFEVAPNMQQPTLKEILPALFAPIPGSH
jgi:hypothetical protein